MAGFMKCKVHNIVHYTTSRKSITALRARKIQIFAIQNNTVGGKQQSKSARVRIKR